MQKIFSLSENVKEAILPYFSSFLLHIGFALIFVFLLFAFTNSSNNSETEKIIVPYVSEDLGIDVYSNLPRNGIGHDLSRPTLQSHTKIDSNGLDPNGKTNSVLNSVSGVGSADTINALFISGGSGGNLGGIGSVGIGTGEPGKIAGYGIEGGGGPILNVPLGNATKIVYVLDNSGSMLDTFDYLKMEVNDRIDRMIPVFKINIVMFSEDINVLGKNEKLNNLTVDYKRELKSKLNSIGASGKNDDMLEPFSKAINKAFQMRPEIVVLLTDGNFDPELVNVVNKLNAEKRVKVNTIAYINISKDSEDSLKRISSENGGIYKFVSKEMVK